MAVGTYCETLNTNLGCPDDMDSILPQVHHINRYTRTVPVPVPLDRGIGSLRMGI